MNISVEHPRLKKLLELELQPASNDREPGWLVALPEGNTFFITCQNQQWIVRHNNVIEPKLVSAIGNALEHHLAQNGEPEAFKNDLLQPSKPVMYTIMGASGQIGSAVVKELTARHLPVRAVVHQRDKADVLKKLGAEVVFADTFDLPSLIMAFAGSQALFVITPETGHNVDLMADTKTMLDNYRQAIAACGVKRVIGLSSLGAHLGEGSGNLEISHLLEQAFDGLGVDQVFLRPAYYFSNWLMGAEVIRKTGLLYSFYPQDLVMPMVSPGDVARIAAELLTREEQGKLVYEIEGPAACSPADVAWVMAAAISKPVNVKQIPKQDWKTALKKIGFSRNAAENFIKMTDCVVSGQVKPEGKGTIALKATTTLEQYMEQFFGEREQVN